MDKSARNGQLRLSLTIDLPPDVSLFLNHEMNQQSYAGEEQLVIAALRLMIKKRGQARGQSAAKSIPKDSPGHAPLDAFLPQGTNPFVPVNNCQSEDLPFDFRNIQSRMETGRVPKVLR